MNYFTLLWVFDVSVIFVMIFHAVSLGTLGVRWLGGGRGGRVPAFIR